MDEASIIESLRDFHIIWGRVAGSGTGSTAASPAPEWEMSGEGERLRAFMLSAANAEALYSSLARRFRSAAPALTRLAGAERGQLHALRLEYYLLTGETFTPVISLPEQSGMLGELRRAWQAEGRSEQSYLRAAQLSSLGELYRAHARNERSHAQTLRELIARGLR